MIATGSTTMDARDAEARIASAIEAGIAPWSRALVHSASHLMPRTVAIPDRGPGRRVRLLTETVDPRQHLMGHTLRPDRRDGIAVRLAKMLHLETHAEGEKEG